MSVLEAVQPKLEEETLDSKIERLRNEFEVIKSLIATEAIDSVIQLCEWQKGREAAVEGKVESDCPWTGGLSDQWWRDGFNNRNFPIGMIRAQ